MNVLLQVNAEKHDLEAVALLYPTSNHAQSILRKIWGLDHVTAQLTTKTATQFSGLKPKKFIIISLFFEAVFKAPYLANGFVSREAYIEAQQPSSD